MREKMLAIAKRLRIRADEIRDDYPLTTKDWSESPQRVGRGMILEVAKAIEDELTTKAPRRPTADDSRQCDHSEYHTDACYDFIRVCDFCDHCWVDGALKVTVGEGQ